MACIVYLCWMFLFMRNLIRLISDKWKEKGTVSQVRRFSGICLYLITLQFVCDSVHLPTALSATQECMCGQPYVHNTERQVCVCVRLWVWQRQCLCWCITVRLTYLQVHVSLWGKNCVVIDSSSLWFVSVPSGREVRRRGGLSDTLKFVPSLCVFFFI